MKTSWTVLAAMAAVLLLPTLVRAEDPNKAYQDTYGDAAKKIAAKDAAAFAQTLIDDSATMKDDPAMAELLLVKAQEFYYRIPTDADKAKVADALIKRWLAVADARLGEGNAAEALAALEKAARLASATKSEKQPAIEAKAKGVKARIEVDRKLADLLAKIAAKPDDAATAKSLVLLYVLYLDKPDKAKPYVQTAGDEALKTYVPLAAVPLTAKDAASLGEQALNDLGGWYAGLAEKAGPFGKAVAYGRAKAYYEFFLAKHGKQDTEAIKAQRALATIDKELDKLSDLSAAMTSGAREIVLDCGNNVQMKLVLIPPGKFVMGSPKTEKGHEVNEEPQHPVAINKAFYMGVYEVTQAQYEAVMKKNPSFFKDPNKPVANVSWDDAVVFCEKLSEKTRKTVRLPTEAEWEYACRAGTTTAYSFGDDTGKLSDFAWCSDSSQSKPPPLVGQKKPNPAGLYDMHGGVWEWCSDWYSDKYDVNAKPVDPQGPTAGHVVRGGSWFNPLLMSRSASRNVVGSRNRNGNIFCNGNIGFRVVVAAGPGVD